MSVTTTENPVTHTLHETLHDYDIRLTGADAVHSWVPLTDHEAPDASVENPAGWDDEHRGVPRFRPINRRMDLTQRPWGSHPIETGFVVTMFSGVYLQATLSWAWRHTGGRFNDSFFRWKVGGEF